MLYMISFDNIAQLSLLLNVTTLEISSSNQPIGNVCWVSRMQYNGSVRVDSYCQVVTDSVLGRNRILY